MKITGIASFFSALISDTRDCCQLTVKDNKTSSLGQITKLHKLCLEQKSSMFLHVYQSSSGLLCYITDRIDLQIENQ